MLTLKTSLLVLCLIGTTMAESGPNDQALRAVSQGANEFSSSFFQAVAAENSGNLITSPLSAAVVLAMAAYGARGETENQFRSVLHLPSPDSLGISGYQSLIDTLNNVKENKLHLANKVFANVRFSVKPTYKELTENYFRSVSEQVNFAMPSNAANTINTWVRQNTNNRIDSIVSAGDLNDRTAMVLVNAVYFKGQWKNKFDPALTKDLPFHVNEQIQKNVPMMFRQGNYNYGELPSLNATFVEIPYKGNELSMVIILPNEVNGLPQLEKNLQSTSINDILNQGYNREVQLYLPKFKIESKMNLNGVLQHMGLTDMFSARANFSGIADEDLAVSKVVQKAFIEVNEEGSEAAAATGTIIMKLSMEYPVELAVTRPFYFNIVKTMKDQHGSRVHSAFSIFSGQVVEPAI